MRAGIYYNRYTLEMFEVFPINVMGIALVRMSKNKGAIMNIEFLTGNGKNMAYLGEV